METSTYCGATPLRVWCHFFYTVTLWQTAGGHKVKGTGPAGSSVAHSLSSPVAGCISPASPSLGRSQDSGEGQGDEGPVCQGGSQWPFKRGGFQHGQCTQSQG